MMPKRLVLRLVMSLPAVLMFLGLVLGTGLPMASPVRAAAPGDAWAWGDNGHGKLGDGTVTDRSTPVQVSGLTGVTAVAGGYDHSLALKSDGTVRAWGYNFYGQLGDGTNTQRTAPVQVSSLTDVIAIATGGFHGLALKSDGTVWAWGYNLYGQLGDGTNNQRSTPVQVSGLTGVTAIAAGSYHSLALKSDGTVWAWGYNDSGQLGDTTFTNRSVPVQVSGLTGVTAIAAGSYHSLAVKSDGNAWAWGNNIGGRLGYGTNAFETAPVQVSVLTGVTAVAGGELHSLALKSDGTVWAWGTNFYGQLGDNTTDPRNTPAQVGGVAGVAAIAAGTGHSLALKSDGTAWVWGYNADGELGDGTTTNRLTPIQVSGLTGVTAIGGGWFHSLAIAAPLASPDLALGLTDAPDPVFPGGLVTYELTVTNNGTGDATGVAVTNTLPANSTYQSDTHSQGTVSAGGGAVTWSIGNLASGASASMQLRVNASSQTGNITNSANVTLNGTDANPDDNQASASTMVANPVWTGSGNWSSGSNWNGQSSTLSSLPITFDGTSTSNSTIDAAATIGGLAMAGGYTGTLTQNNALTINGAFSQASGTFTGGASNFDLNGGFSLSGGTFTSPSGNLNLTGNWAHSAGTFSSNSGTVIFDGSGTQTISGANTFYNLTINNTGGAGVKVDASGSTLHVAGTLRVQDGIFKSATDYVDVMIDNGATLELAGDITVSGNFTSNGTLLPNGHTVTFNGAGDQTISGATSPTNFASLVVNKPSGAMIISSAVSAATVSIAGADVAINNSVTASGGAVTVTASGAITGGGAIDTSSASGAGGNISLTAGGAGGITIGALTTKTTAAGANAGSVTLTASTGGASITTGIISANAAPPETNDSGSGGAVSATADTNVAISSIDTSTVGIGNVNPGYPEGPGGSITLTATQGYVQTGDLASRSFWFGGNLNGDTSNGGSVTITSGTSTQTGVIDARTHANDGKQANPHNGGAVSVNAGTSILTGFIYANSFANSNWPAAPAKAGNGGAITLTAQAGGITVSADGSGDSLNSYAKVGVGTNTQAGSAGVVNVSATGGSVSIAGKVNSYTSNSAAGGANTVGSGAAITLTSSNSTISVGAMDSSASNATGATGNGGAVTLNGSTGVTVSAITATSGSAASGNISLTGDAMALGGTVASNGGAVVLQPTTATTSIGIGDGAAGSFNLTTTEVGYLADGFAGITIGRANGQHAIALNAVSFADPVTIRTPSGGSIAVNGTLTGTGNASITLDGSGATTTLSAGITTSGQPISISDSLVVAEGQSVQLSTSGGAISISGTTNGTVGGAAETLTLAPGNGTVTFTGAVGDSQPLAIVQTGGTGTTAFNGGLGLAGTSTFNGFAGTLDVNGALSIGVGATLTAPAAGTFTVSGNWSNSGSFTHNGGTLTFDGAGTQTLDGGGSSFFTVTHPSAGTLKLSNNALIAVGVLTISGGVFDTNGLAITVGGLTVSGGTFTGSTGSVDLNGDLTLSSGTLAAPSGAFTVSGNWSKTGGTFTPGANTVTFDGAGTQALDSGGASFGNIVHSGAGLLRLVSSALTVSGALTNSGGTFEAFGQAVTVAGSATISGGVYVAVSGTQTFNGGLTVSGGTFAGSTGAVDVNGDVILSGGTLAAPSGAFTVSGNWSKTGGIFTPGANTVTFDRAAGTQTMDSGGSTFFNVTHSGAGTLRVSANLAATGAFTNSLGSFDANGKQVTVTGLATVSGGTYLASSATQTFNGGLTVSGGAFTGSTGAVDVNGNLTLSGGTLTAPSGSFTVSGNFTHGGGTFAANGGTVTFDNGVAQNLDAGVATTFNNLTVTANTILVELAAADNVTVAGALTNNGTIRKSQTISGAGVKTFGLTAVSTNVTTQGGLSGLQVDRIDSSHASAPTTGLQTGKHWDITPIGAGYTLDLTLPFTGLLPNSGADNTKAQVCHWDGLGANASNWSCARASSTASSVTRTGITSLSSWVVGDPEADVTATKADSPDPVLINQTITYTPYTVKNNGPYSATNVELIDTLPAGVSAIVANTNLGGSCGVVGLVVTCTWPTLASGATATVTLTVTAPNSPQNMILNLASVTALEYDPSLANNSTSSGTTVIDPAPGTGVMTFSATWFVGSLTLDANLNGNTTDGVDQLSFALADTNSDGVYDRLDLSLGNSIFAQGGNLGDKIVSISNDDEMLLWNDASRDITLGSQLFTVDFPRNPGNVAVTTDLSITSKTWYKGTFTADLTGSGLAADTANFVLVDANSDGLYDTMDLSTDDATYGEVAGGALGDGHTGTGDDEEAATDSLVRLGSYESFIASFVNNPGDNGGIDAAGITSSTWYAGTFRVDMDFDGDLLDDADIVAFFLGDTDSDGRYDAMDISTDDGQLAATTFGEGTLSGQSPRRTGAGDDETLGTGTGGGNTGGSADVRLGPNYLFTVAFDNNPALAAHTDDARITAKTHYEGSFLFDADRNGFLEHDGSNTVFFGVSDTNSDGLYDAMDLSLTPDGVALPAYSQFNQGAVADHILSAGNDERFAIAGAPWRMTIGTAATLAAGTAFQVDASFESNPPADTQDASVLQVSAGPPLVYAALNSWQIDADGDTVADDHVMFVLSATGSTGTVDTIDISIGNLTFGQNVNDSYASADGATDARFGGECPCGKVIKLGTHYFLVEFFSDVLTRTDDARITSRWYTGSFPVDVDNDRVDNTVRYVLLDPDSDGVYTVMELDGNADGAYSADEVHKSAGSLWGNPKHVASAGDVGTHTAIAAVDINTVFIAYHDVDNADLKFTKTTNAGLDWTTPVSIDGTADVGRYASIAAIGANTLVVSYYDATNGDLKFAKSVDGGTTWSKVIVDSAGDVGQYSRIAAVDANTMFIGYYDATTNSGNLKVARTTTGGGAPADWSTVTVDGTANVGKYTSISALSANRVYAGYYDAANGNLKFARTTNGGAAPGDWTTVTVDSSANDVGQYTSIAAVHDTTPNDDAAAGDTVFVSYYDATGKDLKFARTPSGGDAAPEWTISTIDSTGDVGRFSALYATEMSTAFVAYFDATNERLKSITSTNGGASFNAPVVVDSGGVGEYVSLAGIQVHTLFASYYDAHNHDLKYARSVLLVDLEGHRMSIRSNFNPTVPSSAVLKDGSILQVAQLDDNHWLFTIPRQAELGPNIEQSQIRVVVQAPDEIVPGYYEIKLTVRQTEG